MCENTDDVIFKIQKIIKKHYNIQPRYEEEIKNFVQIVLPKTIGTPLEVCNLIRQELLVDNRMLADCINLDKKHKNSGVEYNKIILGSVDKFDNLDVFSKYMNSIIINYNIQNATNCNFSGTSQKNCKKIGNKQITENWIQNNLPIGNIPRSEYYSKYTNGVKNICTPLNQSHFGRILKKICGSDKLGKIVVSGEICYSYSQ
jgi:hypothetical protein